MANTIELAEKFQPILDEIYKRESLTARMDALTKPVNFAGANVVKVFKTNPSGLGTYNRSTGYPSGSVQGTWETLTLTTDRGTSFTIDRMDDEETLGMSFGTLVSEFMRTEVAPELDAYRFSRYASWADIQEVAAPGTITLENVVSALDTAKLALDKKEVPSEGRILYISDECLNLLEQKVARVLGNESAVDTRVTSFNGMPIVMVPQTRFYKGIKLLSGSDAEDDGGFEKAATGVDINFMIIHPSAVLQIAKHENLKVFSPDVNQTTDGWLVQYRIYHDAFVYDNKVNGIYSHVKAS